MNRREMWKALAGLAALPVVALLPKPAPKLGQILAISTLPQPETCTFGKQTVIWDATDPWLYQRLTERGHGK